MRESKRQREEIDRQVQRLRQNIPALMSGYDQAASEVVMEEKQTQVYRNTLSAGAAVILLYVALLIGLGMAATILSMRGP